MGRLRLGACALGLVAIVTLARPTDAASRAIADAPSASPSAAPSVLSIPGTPAPQGRVLNPGQPTPYPLNTLAPLGSGTPRPFPIFGSPVPGVGLGTPPADVPATVSLQQAVAIGFARSPLLRAARADVAVQAAVVRIDRAGLLPSFSGSSSLDYIIEQGGAVGTTTTTGTGAPGTTGTVVTTGGAYRSYNAAFGLSLAQLVYDGGKIAAGVDAARSSEAALADTYARDLQTVAFDVGNAYYAYLAAQRTTQVDLEIVREDVVQENLVRAQVRAGTSARADIATTQLPTAQARLAVVRAQGAEISAEAAFVNAMGLDANANVQPLDDAPVFTTSQVSSVPIPSYEKAIARAIALRPDYDSSVQTIRQARSTLREASLGLFPTLSASASAADDSTQQNVGAFRNNQSIGLALSIPIYDQGITAANVASGRAQVEVANAGLATTELGIQLSVKQALANLVAARAALDETQQEYATAVINVESTQAQYRAGVTTLPLLLNAQVQLTQALTDQVTAVYSLRENEQSYLYAVGANYDPSQFTLPKVAKGGHGATVAHDSPMMKRLTAAIH